LASNVALENDCKSHFKSQQEISVRNNTVVQQRVGSLFFDAAIASRNPFIDAKPSIKHESSSSTLPINSSPKTSNFGNWNNLKKYFSYSSLSTISKSPRNHTEFKQVAGQVKDEEIGSSIRHARINLSQDSKNSETSASYCSQDSTISPTSGPSSQSSETHVNVQDTKLPLNDSLIGENEENILEDNRLSDTLTDSTTPVSKILKLTYRKKELTSLSNFASQSKRPCQPISSRRLGLNRKKLQVTCQDDLKKQCNIKELLAKFNYTNN